MNQVEEMAYKSTKEVITQLRIGNEPVNQIIVCAESKEMLVATWYIEDIPELAEMCSNLLHGIVKKIDFKPPKVRTTSKVLATESHMYPLNQ